MRILRFLSGLLLLAASAPVFAKDGPDVAFLGLEDARKVLLDESKEPYFELLQPMEMQAKILRVVENKEFERVGGQQSIMSDVRLIAATNADLEEEVRSGRFREDLYYRLNVVRIEIPPLRERAEDIPALCEYFLERYSATTGRAIRGITPEAMSLLKAHTWRGNVRELRNVIEMAIALEDESYITSRYLPAHILSRAAKREHLPEDSESVLESVVKSFERRFLTEQLRLNDWAQAETARTLGVHRNTLENKMKKYGIRKPG